VASPSGSSGAAEKHLTQVANEIKFRWGHSGLEWVVNPMAGTLIRKDGCRETQAHKEGGLVKAQRHWCAVITDQRCGTHIEGWKRYSKLQRKSVPTDTTCGFWRPRFVWGCICVTALPDSCWWQRGDRLTQTPSCWASTPHSSRSSEPGDHRSGRVGGQPEWIFECGFCSGLLPPTYIQYNVCPAKCR
jgi:hypothetical protein